jgi:hypothetical protein
MENCQYTNPEQEEQKLFNDVYLIEQFLTELNKEYKQRVETEEKFSQTLTPYQKEHLKLGTQVETIITEKLKNLPEKEGQKICTDSDKKKDSQQKIITSLLKFPINKSPMPNEPNWYELSFLQSIPILLFTYLSFSNFLNNSPWVEPNIANTSFLDDLDYILNPEDCQQEKIINPAKEGEEKSEVRHRKTQLSPQPDSGSQNLQQ